MSQHTELIARLRAACVGPCLIQEAADALQAMERVPMTEEQTNELRADALALRVSVQHRLDICHVSMASVATKQAPLLVEIWRDGELLLEHYSDTGGRLEATRKAIDRAANKLMGITPPESKG